MQGRGSWAAGGRKWMDRMRGGWERSRRRSAQSGPNFLAKCKAILVFQGPASIITAAFANNSIKQGSDDMHSIST
jgi:hypothetical protein